MSVRVPERVRSSADVALSVVLAVVVVVTVATDRHLTPRALLLPVAVVLTLPLAVRRRYPAAVAVVVVAAYAAMNGLSRGPYPPDLAVVPAMVAVFGGGAYTRGRVAVAVGVTTFAGVELAWLVTPDGHLDDFVPWVLWGGPFGVGRLTRRRDTTVSELTLHARVLESERAAAEQEAARRERDRIAREMHDVIAHAVSLMVVQAGAERLALGAAGEDVARTTTALDRIERAGREALGELRAMLGVLRGAEAAPVAPVVPQATLDAVRHELVERLVGEGLDIRLDVVGTPCPSHDVVGVTAYRIVQEALTNAVKHGTPGPIRVQIRYDDDAVGVLVSNPCGPRSAGDGVGYGLVGARERAASLGGQFAAAREGDRWVLSARLPCTPRSVRASA
jgi:signal transduction histidine kinase